jgi:serine protease Do
VVDAFVRVRLVRITGADLNIFDFDYDLTWAAFFLSADGVVYGRFGGRDAKGPDTRNSLLGLRFALEQALAAHREHRAEKPSARPPVFVEEYPSAHKVVRNGCVHCHQVSEIRRRDAKDAGTWKRASVWAYPLPENIGVTLDRDRGDRVQTVIGGSLAAKAGLKASDTIKTLNGRTVFSFADAQYVLHHAPTEGSIDITWTHDRQTQRATLQLANGWRRTDLTWRPSMLDLLPTLAVSGHDLSISEKKSIDLAEKQLAFRQSAPVHSEAQAIGVRAGDIILGIDNLALEMTADRFRVYVRQTYLVGDRVTLNVLRDGKKIGLTTKLR